MKSQHVLAAAFATVALALAGAPANSAEPWQSAPSADRLLDDLKVLTEKSERDQRARRNLTQDLRGLIARYEWPWSRLLLSDTFADGDHARNPAWVVRSGRFEVDRDRRLVSTQEIPRAAAQPSQPAQSQGSVGQQLLGNLLEQMNRPQHQQQQQQAPSQAASDRSEISTPVKITNAFDLRVALQSVSNEGRIEFGPYLAGAEHQGYRLVYLPNGTPPLALVRYSASGSGIVQAAEQQAVRPQGAGRDQNIQWMRSENGEMSVFLNGEVVIRTQDNAFTKGFDGLVISNLAGTHAIREVTLYGAAPGQPARGARGARVKQP